MNTLHQSGDRVRDRYEILERLGQGGMGITYKAKDWATDRIVAIKALSLHQLTDWKALELFEREARVLENLSHPQIPAYLDHFQVDTPRDRLFYLVQELAAGKSLAEWVAAGWRCDEAAVKAIAVQLLEILDYLHSRTPPVIHRDIKPQNIIRQSNGRLYLVDFGAVQAAYRHTLSGGSTVVGTFGYMPPEQFRGQAEFATDLYSLGATLLFVLTHQNPADLPQKRMRLQFRDRLQLSEPFADWLETMVEPAIEDRFQSAAAALQALQQPAIAPRPLVPVAPAPVALTKPAGTRVIVKRNPTRLEVTIPPAGLFHPMSMGLMIFAIFWNGFIFFWTMSAIAMRAPIFFPLFSIPFWIVGVGMLGMLGMVAFGHRRMVFGAQTFAQEWWCLGFRRSHQGPTADLSPAEVKVQTDSDGHRTVELVYWEGVRQHTFGYGLTEIEQKWLATEINNFLAQIRH